MTKGKEEVAFFSLPEFECWKAKTENVHTWKIKYYKGLGTSTAKEAKEYFSDMDRHRIPFKYLGQEDDDAINLVSYRCLHYLVCIHTSFICILPIFHLMPKFISQCVASC